MDDMDDMDDMDPTAELRRRCAEIAHQIRNPCHAILLDAPLLRQVWEEVEPLLDEHLGAQPGLRLAGLPYDEMRHEVPQMIAEILDAAGRIERCVDELRECLAPPAAVAAEPEDPG